MERMVSMKRPIAGIGARRVFLADNRLNDVELFLVEEDARRGVVAVLLVHDHDQAVDRVAAEIETRETRLDNRSAIAERVNGFRKDVRAFGGVGL
jgi:hypothetical protein